MPKTKPEHNAIHAYLWDKDGTMRQKIEQFGDAHGLTTSAVFRIAINALLANPEQQMSAISRARRLRS